MQDTVLPYLRGRMGTAQVVIKAKLLRTAGLGESWIDERIDSQMRSANPTVGLAAHHGMVDIRITARAATEAEADAMITEMEAQVRDRIGGDGIFGVGSDRLEEVTAQLLAQAGVKLAILESATGGEIARQLRSAPAGASVVTAAHVVDGPDSLAAALHLSPAKLTSFGWISQMVAAEAAALLIDTYEGGWGLAALGDITPNDVYSHETGQTFVVLGTPSETVVRHYPYSGSGFLARTWITVRSLDLLRRQALAKLAQAKA
jgi:nicotinamide-nucleotide amidase